MTEPIRAAEVLAEWCVGDDKAASGNAYEAWLEETPDAIARLLALFPEGDVVIRRDGTVAGLEWAYYSSEGEMHRLVPLSREADR